MDNKLSELSNPVAYKFDHGVMGPGDFKYGTPQMHSTAKDENASPLYSQEYASALLARIAELEAIRAAAEKLVRCKGRYHSEQNYRTLAALFGVTTPDLPPVDGDSEAVIAELRAKLATPVRLPGFYKDADGNVWLNPVQVVKEIRHSGFTVEGDE